MADRTVRVRVAVEAPGAATTTRSVAGGLAAVGEAAVVAGRGMRTLGADAAVARGGLAAVGVGARGGVAALSESEAAALAASRGLRGVRGEAAAATGAFGRIGAAAGRGFGQVRSGAESALGSVKHLGLLLAGGAILYGLHDIIHAGNEYTDSMNKFLEVTRASGAQMLAAGREAQALGADMKLPSATASEAADAMVDLAKAGLSAQDAIKAARGTIQLAAAARTDVATSAQIEGDIMDQFSLKSSEAANVADVLANTANSASGQLMDIYYAMKYVGPIAHTMGVSVKDTATAVGLLGKSGIIGETAGTALRSALVNMAKPTKAAKEGLHALGIEAFDSGGNFKGLKYVITALGNAQEHMTAQQFTMNAAMAFGKPALSGMTALAHQGGTAFEQFGIQVGRVGGAAALAAAESKGLGGSMRGLGKQISSAFLQVYLGIAPTLEKITRGMTSSVSSAIPYIKSGIRIAGDLWSIYGPTVEGKLTSATSGIKKAAKGMADPLKAAIAGAAVTSVPLAITSIHSLGQALDNAGAAATPLVGGLKDMFGSVSSGAGALGVFAGRIQVGVGALGDMSAVLRPIGQLVGGLAHAFAGLPGPIQLSLLAMLAMRPFRPQILGMQSAVTGFGRAGVTAFRGIGDASLYQRVQAANAGVTLGRFGGAMAELEQRSPTIRRMGDSFRSASGSIQQAGGRLVGFRAAAGGAATAIGTGAKAGLLGAGKGLVSFMGGPWGIAIAAAMVGLDLFARNQQKAAQATRETQQRVGSLSEALRNSSQVIDTNVRDIATQNLMQQKSADSGKRLVDLARDAQVPMRQLVDAYLGQGTSLGTVKKQLDAVATAQSATFVKPGTGDSYTVYTKQGQAAHDLSQQLTGLSGDYKKAVQDAKDYQDAVAAGQDPTSRLSDAIDTLAQSSADADTKARALHTALDLLSGGELDVQAATADMNQAILDLNSTWKDGADHTKGWKNQLLQVDGSLNTTTANGQALWTKMQALNESTASAAQATYDYARSQGTAVVPALKQAEASMQTAWKTAVTAGQKFGLTAAQAEVLAAQMGFIPSNLAITMSTPGLDQTTKDLLYVQGLAGHLPKNSTVKVSALTAEAAKDITSLGYKVTTLPGGRQMEITAPTSKAAAALDALIAKKLPGKVLGVSTDGASTIASLEAVKAKLADVPHGKSITLSAPTAAVIGALEAVGFKVKTLPNHKVSITVPTSYAFNSTSAIQNAVNNVAGKTVDVYVQEHIKAAAGRDSVLSGSYSANGNIFRAYAEGGMEQHVAQIAPAGSWRIWGEPETGGESYIPLAASKRQRSRKIAEDTVRLLGGKGIAWYAAGGVQRYASGGFTYTPTTPGSTLGGAGSGMDRYTTDVGKLSDAWKVLYSAIADQTKKTAALRAAEDNLGKVRADKHHTAAELASAEKKLSDARTASAKANQKVSYDRKVVNNADAALGLKAGTKVPGFNLAAYSKELAAAAKANSAWEANLASVGKRAGADVEQTLRDMGADGQALVAALAKASGKSFTDIVNNLKALAPTAKATLADYTNQLKASTATSKTFQADLLKLASMGYGDLAAQLAGQGDDAAAAIAAAAVKSPGAASSADTAAKSAASTLSADDLSNALTLIGVLKGKPGAGISDVLAAGLDLATLKTLLPKIQGQINTLPSSATATFLSQMAGQSGAVAMAHGGILTQPTAVLAGEAGPEAYIPLNHSARSRSLLAASAAALGYHLVPASRYASSSGAGGSAPNVTHNHRSVTLHGAKQSSAEQLADVVRTMQFIG